MRLGEDARFFLGTAAIIAVVLAVILGGAMAATRAVCTSTATVMGVDHRWKVWGGCFVLVGDDWVPLDLYRLQEEGDR